MSHPMETYYGTVKSPADAIKLFEACRLGLLPRVQRRLSEKERQQIRSGSVFVWDEREAGMRRWTDGKSWSASRVSGSFLTYREMEGKRASGFGGPGGRRTAGKTPDSGRGSDEDQDDGEPDGYRYKIDGLIKQSFSITTSQGQHLHLISYFSRGGPELMLPTQDIKLRGVHPAKGLYPESNLNEPSGPATMRGPMQHQPVYTGPPPPPQGPPHPAHSPYHPAPYSQPPPSYSQPSSAWPPSPVATPPYSSAHYHQPPQPYPPHTLPPPQQHHPHGPPPAMAYSHGSAHQYDRLPPPQPALPAHHRPGMILPQPYPIQNQPHSPHQQYQHPLPHPSPQPHSYHSQQQPPQPPPPPPQQQEQQQQQQQQQHITSPHSPHAIPQRSSRLDSLQAAAAQAAVMIDPALAAQLGRSPQGPQQSQNGTLTLSPPYRNRSPSPPGNRAPDGKDANGQAAGNKASLSAILHPVSVGSESNGADSGLNGGHSPPRAPSSVSTNGPTTRNGRETMEARAIGALDKTFCMT